MDASATGRHPGKGRVSEPLLGGVNDRETRKTPCKGPQGALTGFG